MVESVNILSDQGDARHQSLQMCQGDMGRIRLGPKGAFPSHAIPTPYQRWVSLECLGRREILGPVRGPVSRQRVAKRREPTLGAHAGAGEHRYVAGAAESCDWLPFHPGV
jgi:hypothetical protein